MIHRIYPPGPRAFSDSVEVAGRGRFVFISGQVAVREQGDPDDFAFEVRACFARIREALQRANVDWSHVIRIDAYITDLELYGTYAEVRSEIFGDEPPASTTVQVAGLLSSARIEINGVAFSEK